MGPIAALLLGGLLLAGATGGSAGDEPGPEASKHIAGVPVHNYHWTKSGSRGVDGLQSEWTRWIVVMKPEFAGSAIERLCGGEGGPCRHLLKGSPDAGGVPFVEVDATEVQLEAALTALQEHEIQADFIEPNRQLHLTPGIPVAAEHLTAQSSASWGLDRVGVPSAARTGEGVHIYVLDTGIHVSHVDFEGRAVPTLDASSGQWLVECGGNPMCAADRMGHGTHCAATAAGKEFGVAKGATVHAVKVLADNGMGMMSWSLAAVDWVTVNGLRPAVVSMSLGGASTDWSTRLAIEVATRRGITVVVAAGNEADDACRYSPAFVPCAVTVAASDTWDRRAFFSNYGRCNDLFAPGAAITSAWFESNTDTRTLSGTSMACPHVSGAAALLLEAHPGWTPAQVAAGLRDTSERGSLSRLQPGDPNLLLSVAATEAHTARAQAAQVLNRGGGSGDGAVAAGGSSIRMASAALAAILTAGALVGAFVAHVVARWFSPGRARVGRGVSFERLLASGQGGAAGAGAGAAAEPK